ncbi:MAG TPA: PadR family transcriptional regulator [Gemmatimonadales bacterium]|nr:PadR family transcriptional regulator [Gemmatimonadales bacterium]
MLRLPGLLDFCILRALRWEPTHGAGVAAWIRLVTGGALDPEEGTLYPALHRMERRGLIESEWMRSETNRKARHYQLTTAGRQQLRLELERWALYGETIDKLVRYGSARGL